jgi:hypothetical protein
MNISLSRALSLLVVAAAYVRVWWISHTPGVAVAALGWVFLLLFALTRSSHHECR